MHNVTRGPLKCRDANALGPAALHAGVVTDVVDDLGLLLLATTGTGLLHGSWGGLATLLPLRYDLEQLGRFLLFQDAVRYAPAE